MQSRFAQIFASLLRRDRILLFCCVGLLFYSHAASVADRVSAYNGRVLTDLLVAKSFNADDADAASRFKDAVSWLNDQDVILRGHLADISSRWFSRGVDLVVTIGRVREQAVNVKLRIRPESASDAAKLKVGQDVSFRGKVSGSWDLLNDLVLSEATPIGLDAAESALNEANENLEDVLGECIVQEQPFAILDANRRGELLEMAYCANSAYPEHRLPFGYRPMSRQEWNSATSECGYSPDVFSEDGYVVFGNGLRGRILVHRLYSRVVIAWSGCDLTGRDIRLAGGLDFATCVEHLFSGNVESQFDQALDISREIVKQAKGAVWIVGHSLGGCLTTYISLKLDKTENVEIRAATFNGLGVATPLARGMSSDCRNRGAQRLTNVYCSKDPVYNGHRVTAWMNRPPHHFGRSYFIAYQGDGKDIGLLDQIALYHGMDDLCRQMSLLCHWYENKWIWLLVAFSVAVVLILGLRFLKNTKGS